MGGNREPQGRGLICFDFFSDSWHVRICFRNYCSLVVQNDHNLFVS